MDGYLISAIAAATIAVLIFNLFVLTIVFLYRKWRCKNVNS